MALCRKMLFKMHYMYDFKSACCRVNFKKEQVVMNDLGLLTRLRSEGLSVCGK